MELLDTVFVIAVIMFSVIIHEVMHGVAADSLGDPTARYAGRLTLNPIPHLDLFGSIILPVLCALSPGGFLFGWAKPVPYNPYNLFRAPRWGEAIVAAAGPASNLVIAVVTGLVIRLNLFPDLAGILLYIIAINVSLTLLNLIPVPPLDGSKILSSVLPKSFGYDAIRDRLEQNPFFGFGIVLLLIVIFGSAFGTLVYGVAHAIAGI